METGVAKIKEDEINPDWSFDNLNTSVSLELAVNSFYNVTPIESQINHTGENSRTQSSITLTGGKTINNSSSASRCSVNVRVSDTEGYVTNNSVHASGFLKEIVENIYNNSLIDTPRILFNASKTKHKKIRKNTLKILNRKSHRIARLVTYYNRHYKYKNPEKIIPRKFKTYYDKTRRNPANKSRIQQYLFAKSVVKVSRSTILKKVLSKENLFNEIGTIKSNDIQQRTVLRKDPSEETLTRINSESSHNDSIHTKTPTSVIEIPNRKSVTKIASNLSITFTNGTSDLYNQSHETYYDNESGKYHEHSYTEESINHSSFKTEIEVALVLNDESTLKYTKNNSNEQSRQEILYKGNLTSAESFMSESDIFNITSSQDTSETDTQNMNLSKKGDDKISIVINDMVNTFNNTSVSDTFVITETSSRFKNTSDSIDMSSEQTLTSELTNQTSPCNIYFQPTPEAKAKIALDTNETICLKPDRCSSNSFSTDNYLTNNIIITDELRRIPFAIRELRANKNISNIMHKSFSVDNDGDRPKNINLPNEDTIRSILETDAEKKSCSEEFRNFIPQADIMDKLISFLDTAIKRMEDSLLKRIGSEIKNTLDKFEKLLPLMDEHDFVKSDIKFESTDENKMDSNRLESGGLTVLEEEVQCVLVKNEIIDELTKMKIEGETNVECPVQVTESKVMIINEDSFKVLKPVELSTSVEDRSDSYMTSSFEGVRVKRLSKKSSLLSYLTVPIHFIKTNILVLTSVPAFFMSIFLLYSFFLLLV